MIVPLLLLGAGAFFFLLKKPASASAESGYLPYIPTYEEIRNAPNLDYLDAYYELISELLITGSLTIEEYQVLYQAYFDRSNELNPISQYRYDDMPSQCVCPSCGYVLDNPSGHCQDYTCPECGNILRRTI